MEIKENIYVNGVPVGYKLRRANNAPVAPETTPKMTKGTFIDRLGLDKHVALLELAKTDAVLAAAKHSLDIRDYIDVTNPATIQMVHYMQGTGVIDEDDIDMLLAEIEVTELGAIV